jgi:hypothetical protein
MAFGVALEMYRLYGTHIKRAKRTTRKPKPHAYPWQKRRRAA